MAFDAADAVKSEIPKGFKILAFKRVESPMIIIHLGRNFETLNLGIIMPSAWQT